MAQALEARLQRLEDLEEIRQLFVDYGYHLDRCDFASYGTLFAEEGEILLGPMGRAKGPAAIQAMMEKVLGGKAGASYHVIANPIITFDESSGGTSGPNRATTDVTWVVVSRDPEGKAQVPMLGRHKDVVTRENGRWKFLRREGHIDIPSKYENRA